MCVRIPKLGFAHAIDQPFSTPPMFFFVCEPRPSACVLAIARTTCYLLCCALSVPSNDFWVGGSGGQQRQHQRSSWCKGETFLVVVLAHGYEHGMRRPSPVGDSFLVGEGRLHYYEYLRAIGLRYAADKLYFETHGSTAFASLREQDFLPLPCCGTRFSKVA